jgi:S1-C subfamily serine protease
MTFDTNNDQSDQTEKKKRTTRWAVGCGVVAIAIVCLVVFLALGGFAGLIAFFGGDPEGLTLEVNTPTSRINVGETFTISLDLSNEGEQNITIKEIQLPNELLEIALVTNVEPASEQGLDYGDQTAFEFDLTIAPTGHETVVFTFQALAAGDISGDLEVSVGTKSKRTAIRVVISAKAASDEENGDAILGDIIPYRSVVQIIAIVEIEGERIQGWSGSGTIISKDGLILTNAHVVLSQRYYEVVDLVVSITTAEDRPPDPMFYADVLQADANLDLAVIKVRSDLQGGPANFSDLDIEPVPLGSSDSLQLGDEIIIIGYPSIGGETITLTRGEVSGFTAEDPYGNRAFIKTSAVIAGGNSGGLAATAQGEIIGVPTQVGSGDIEDMIVDCRPLADTNRDGYIDDNDTCVPTGGFINALRPITLAMPMIEAAKAGNVAIEEGGDDISQDDYNPQGNVVLSDDFSDNSNGWYIGESSDGRADITGGKLLIDVYNVSYVVWSDLPETYNKALMVSNMQVLNPVGDGDFGFICGMEDSDNFTALEVSEDGYYAIWKYENDQFVSLVDWTYSNAIPQGGAFTLAAYCGPDKLYLAVNDTLLAETVDPNYKPGRVGLIAGCYEYPNIRLGFEDFIIYQP